LQAEATLQICVAVVAGLLVGSFLNVCIYRVPRDLSVVTPRSFCPECRKQIAWYDNVPVLSYTLRLGRCRSCRKRIPIRYVLVELVTACLFGTVVAHYGASFAAAKWLAFEALMIVLFWTDLELRILPDEFTIGGTILGIVLSFFVMTPGVLGALVFPGWRAAGISLINAVIGACALALPIWAIGALWQRGRIPSYRALQRVIPRVEVPESVDVLGCGDVKLLALTGAFLGLEKGLAALLIAAVVGSLFGLGYVAVTHKPFAETELPFGSFLCASAAIVSLGVLP
jgi:leader peptidase (prepilin peptidase)/N-methyltransferase